MESGTGDGSELQFTTVTAEGAAERRFSALFNQAQAHMHFVVQLVGQLK